MAEKEEKILPIKERDDGTVVAAIEPEEDLELDEGKAEGGSVKNEEDDEDHHDEDQHNSDDNEDSDSNDDEEREKIREARRTERTLKKELAKQREVSAKNKISALERRNEDLARRLAAVENTTASYQFVQVDKMLEDETTRIEYAKMKLLEASQRQDAVGQVEYLEQLQDAKNRLAQVQAYKKQQLEEAKKPKQNVPTPASTTTQQNAKSWLNSNKWFDPQARDTDSKIAKVVDQELASDGWDPEDPEYWSELDNRLKSRLPHRYAGKNGSMNQRSAGPQGTSRTANPGAKSANTITLSRDRVQAIKDAGAWDDPSRRAKMIKAYANFDKQQRSEMR